jgi:hypothetical protein
VTALCIQPCKKLIRNKNPHAIHAKGVGLGFRV